MRSRQHFRQIASLLAGCLLTQACLAQPCPAATASDHVKESRRLSSIGRIKAAFRECDLAIKMSPKRPEGYIQRGWLFIKVNNTAAAMKELNQAIKLNPKDADGYKSKGYLLRMLKRYDESRTVLEDGIKKNPADGELYYLHAVSCMMQGMHSRAVKDFDQAIKLIPDHPWINHAYFWRARAKQMMGNKRLAIQDFTKAISHSGKERKESNLSVLFESVDSKSKLGQLERGMCYMELGEYSKAIPDLNEVLKITPDEPLLLEQRGMAYFKLGKYKRASMDFNKAVLKGSRSTELYYKMGLNNFAMGRYRQAAVSFEAWFERNGWTEKESPLAIALAYCSLVRDGKTAAGSKLLARASKRMPTRQTWHRLCLNVFYRRSCCQNLMSYAKKSRSGIHMSTALLNEGLYYSLNKNRTRALTSYNKVKALGLKTSNEHSIALAEIARNTVKTK